MSDCEIVYTAEMVGSLIKVIGQYGELMDQIAQHIDVWGGVDRESFLDIFVENDLADLLPETAEGWSE